GRVGRQVVGVGRSLLAPAPPCARHVGNVGGGDTDEVAGPGVEPELQLFEPRAHGASSSGRAILEYPNSETVICSFRVAFDTTKPLPGDRITGGNRSCENRLAPCTESWTSRTSVPKGGTKVPEDQLIG